MVGHDVSTDPPFHASLTFRVDYKLCQTGTHQSPIPLLLTQGLSMKHIPKFDYDHSNVTGQFWNWGYGPAFTLAHNGDYTSLPSMNFDEHGVNETVYLAGWHVHAPADHSVQGDRSKAELHFVHTDAKGNGRAVLAFRIDPGNQASGFFDQLPELISFRDTKTRVNATVNHELALAEVNRFQEFWTYKGSLTSPPCTEGVRWYVARNILFLSVEQMQAVLGVSIYSARAEQEVWQHEINA